MDADSLSEAIDARAPEALERYGVPGLAIGVISHGERVERAFGVASLVTGALLQGDTRFRIASITKPLVATLALSLVEEGLLALDDPLTGLRLPWPGVTLRHLLSHQAGLLGESRTPPADYGEGDDALELLAADDAPGGPVGPGELFAYSNLGYWLVGALIQRAAEMPFEEALQRRVLAPLGMERTAFTAKGPVATGHLTEPGSREHRADESRPYPRVRRPAGGLYSCVGDLLGFAAHQLGASGPLSPGSLRELQTPQVALDPGGDYGLGLFTWQGRGPRTIEHGGSVPGFRSHLVLVPEDDTGIVALANSGRGGLAVEEVLEAVGLDFQLPPEVTVPVEALEAFAGSYREPLGSTVAVSVRDGGLDLELTGANGSGSPPVHMRPSAPDWFVVRDGEDRGESADFPLAGLLRYGWLFERVPD